MQSKTVINSPLGKASSYKTQYDPTLLYPIPRNELRQEISVAHPLPFHGADIWNGYELSWLNKNGKPEIAIAEFIFPCESANLVESKSFKLYLNSLTETHFATVDAVQKILEQDLSKISGAKVAVNLLLPNNFAKLSYQEYQSTCLDTLDITTDIYQYHPQFLATVNKAIEEKLHSNLLKSNCPITNQPDWGSIYIHYIGHQINHEALLKYIISFRNQTGFHEHCVEQIFMDIKKYCEPEKLTVHARYNRRGGLDINPWRSNFKEAIANLRQPRQ